MTMVGADVSALNGAADQLNAAADELDASAAGLASTLGALRWIGTVAVRFTDLWGSEHQPRMAKTSGFLRENSVRLRTQAAEQQRASAADGGSGFLRGIGGLTPDRPGFDWREFVGGGIFFAGKGNDLYDFIDDFEALRKLDAWPDLIHHGGKVKMGPLAVVGTGWDMFNLFDRVSAGDVDGSIRSGIDVAFDIGGLAFPHVGLAKGAWDVGYQIGKGLDWVIGEKLGGHQAFIDSVIVDRYGGTLTPTEADDLGQRYDGWSGFGNYVGDGAKSLWKSIF